jgi:hypothetical protein
MHDEKKFLTMQEFHKMLGGKRVISMETLYNQAKRGELPTVQFGLRKLVPMWYVNKIMNPPDEKQGA